MSRNLSSRAVSIEPTPPPLPERAGGRPTTTTPSRQHPFPHQQLTENAPTQLQEQLVARASALPGVTLTDSCVSIPGARAFRLDTDLAEGPPEAFQCRTEFAHIHPVGDGSLHMTLPNTVTTAAIDRGWCERHPISGTPLIYGPRTPDELETVWQLLVASYCYARGDSGSRGTASSTS